MRLMTKLLSLPSSLILLLLSHTKASSSESVHNVSEDSQTPNSNQWPWNLPSHVRYWPEDPPHRRRDLEAIEEHLRLGRNPVGVMKMSDDAGEKFWPEYWGFEKSPSYTAPFALHVGDKMATYEEMGVRKAGRDVMAALQKRQAQCPAGTSSCTDIEYPNSCCGIGSTCTPIQDTGLGPVGCCPSTGCTGAVTSCNGPNTPCAASLGGGCCIPNYVCSGAICVIDPNLIITSTITLVFTVEPSVSSTITTVVLSTTSPISTTTTTTSTTTTGSTSSLSSSSISSTSCSASFQSCPASLGGGCCPTDRVCGTSSLCPLPPGSTTSTASSSSIASTGESTTSSSDVVPVRPTGVSSAPTTTQQTGTACPTGFYACDAYYAGGCCQTGRDCHTTFCPATSSTTIVTDGRTIVVPLGPAATVASPTGPCATGWSTCAASVGGGCCLEGWSCGTASCSSAGATSTAVAQKGGTSNGVVNKRVNWLMSAGMALICGVLVM